MSKHRIRFVLVASFIYLRIEAASLIIHYANIEAMKTPTDLTKERRPTDLRAKDAAL